MVAGKLEFTQFDPLVAEKHSGLQGLKWEGDSIKRVENKLNWIKSLTKYLGFESAHLGAHDVARDVVHVPPVDEAVEARVAQPLVADGRQVAPQAGE